MKEAGYWQTLGYVPHVLKHWFTVAVKTDARPKAAISA
jgi:hypothetical protein